MADAAPSADRVDLPLVTTVDAKALDGLIAKLKIVDEAVEKSRVIRLQVESGPALSAFTKVAAEAGKQGQAAGAEFARRLQEAMGTRGVAVPVDTSSFDSALKSAQAFAAKLRQEGKEAMGRKEVFTARDKESDASQVENVAKRVAAAMGQQAAVSGRAAAEVAKLRQAEEKLTPAAKDSGSALARQDEILARKAGRLGLVAAESQKLIAKEVDLAAAAGKSADAAARSSSDRALVSETKRNGRLATREFQDEPGTTRRETYNKAGEVRTATETENRVRAARDASRAIVEESRAAIAAQKAQGASVAELRATYESFAGRLDRLAQSNSALESAGATRIGRSAASLRESGANVVSTQETAQRSAAAREADKQRQREEAQARKDEATVSKARFDREARNIAEGKKRSDAEALVGSFGAGGYEKKGSSQQFRSGGSSTETDTYTRLAGGMREVVTVSKEYDRYGQLMAARLSQVEKASLQAGTAARSSQRDFLSNTLTVAAWTASVSTLYGALGLIKTGVTGFIEIERATATLTQVFRGGEEAALGLRDATLQAAAANGRGSGETLEAATRFARLNFTKAESLEAVTVALKAANVAEIDSGRATEQLSAIYAAYGLRVADLRVALNSVNGVSNIYNATVKETLSGIGRVAPLAKQAGLSLNELIGITAAGIGRTGRPGAEIGTALKSLITSLSDPEKGKRLSDQFNFDLKNPTGEIKDFSETLRQLYVRYQELGSTGKLELTEVLGGRQQSSRITAILEGYTQAQVLAIKAARDLNSAETENARVRQTAQLQIAGLKTQYEALAVALARSNQGAGFNQLLTTVVEFTKNVLALGTAAPNVLLTVAAALGFLAVRVIGVATRTTEAGASSNFFIRSLQSVRELAGLTAASLRTLIAEYGGVATAANAAGQAQVVAANRGGSQAVVAAPVSGGAAARSGLSTALSGLATVAAYGKGLGKLTVQGILLSGALYGIEKGLGALNAWFESNADESEKATAKLAGFNEQVEQVRGNAEAAGNVARLAKTLNEVAFRPDANREKIATDLGLLGEVAEPKTPNRLRDAFQENRLTEVASGLQGIITRERESQLTAQQRLAGLQREELTRIREAIRLRESELRAGGKSFTDDDRLKALQKRELESRGRTLNTTLAEPLDDSPSFLKLKSETEAITQARLKGVESIYSALPRRNGVDQNRDDLALVEAKRRALGEEFSTQRAQVEAAREVVQARKADLASSRSEGESPESTSLARLRAAQANLAEAGRALQVAQAKIDDNPAVRGRGVVRLGFPALRNDEAVPEMQRYLAAAREVESQRRSPVPFAQRDLETAQVASAEAAQRVAAQALQSEEAKYNAEREQLRVLKEKLDIAQKELEVTRNAAAVADEIKRGAKEGALGSVISRSSLTDTGNLRRERLILSGGGREPITNTPLGIRSSLADLNAARQKGDPLAEARALGSAREQAVRLDQIGLDLLTRKVTLEAQIAQERARQTQEAGKALLLADRQTQLTAVAATRLAQQRGRGFSASEFAFLDQGTKQALQSTTPDLVPPELNTKLTEMSRELGLAQRELAAFTASLAASTKKLVEDVLAQRPTVSENQQPAAPPVVPSVPAIRTDGVEDALARAGDAMQRGLDAIGTAIENRFNAVASYAEGVAARVSRLEASSAVGRAQGPGALAVS